MMIAAQSYWMPDSASLANIGPIFAMIATTVAVLLGPMIYGRRTQPTAMIALIGAALTLVIAAVSMGRIAAGPWIGMSPESSSPMLLADNFSMFFCMLVSVFMAGVVLLYMIGYNAAPHRTDIHRNAPEFFVLLAGSALGMMLMVSTSNLLMIVIAIELASLPSYAIVGFNKHNRAGAEASLKYVLFGGITSSIMVYGVSLLYGFYGTLDLAVITQTMSGGVGDNLLPVIALFAMLVGVGFKISAVPFHFWCPDVFEGAPIEVTTWLSVVSKAAGLGLLMRVLSMLGQAGLTPDFANGLIITVGIFAALTCTVGNLAALHQTNVKRLLAYSSIAHAGYMLMAAAILTSTPTGAASPAFSALCGYLIIYMLMNLGAFGVVAMVYWATGKEDLSGFTNLGNRNTTLAVAMTILLVSLVGLPPMAGFTAKYLLLMNVFAAKLAWLVIIAVLNTAISLYYYMKIVRQMWLVTDDKPSIAAPLPGVAIVSACALLVVLIGLFYPSRLRSMSDTFSRDLYLGKSSLTVAADVPAVDTNAADDVVAVRE